MSLISLEQFGTILNAIKIKIKNSRGNWNQNDKDADDYIKSRTHYKYLADKVLYSNSELVSDGYFCEYDALGVNMLIEGETYIVNWNGKTYTCIAYNDGYDNICLGDTRVAKDVDGWDFDVTHESGEPFFICTYEPDMYSSLMINKSGVFDVSVIQKDAENIHQLDSAYIKDMYYTDENKKEFKTIVDESFYMDSNSYQLNAFYDLEKGQKYMVNVNGSYYECVAWYYSNWDAIVLGNAQYLGGEHQGDDVPFAIDSYGDGNMYFNTNSYDNYSVCIEGYVPVIHKIAEKYLPDSILSGSNQKQSDWNQTDSSSSDYIKNKPTFNAGNGLSMTNYNNEITVSIDDQTEFILDVQMNEYEPGLYDKDGNLIVSIATLKNTYGMSISNSYTSSTYNTSSSSPYYVVSTYYPSIVENGADLILGNNSSIGDYAFYKCKWLNYVDFCGNVPYLGRWCFADCDIKYVNLPEGLTNLDSAFVYNQSLKQVFIPNSVTTYKGAFGNCEGIEHIYFGKNSKLRTLESHAFTWNTALKDIYIPDGVYSIPTYTFRNCKSLTYVYFGDLSNLTSIENNAFNGCSSLRTLTLPEKLKTIGASAFSLCTDLQKIVLPTTLTTVEDSAFYSCYDLESIDLSNVTSLGEGVLSSCSSLKKVILSNAVTSLPDSLFNRADSIISVGLIGSGSSVEISSELKSIGQTVFSNCGMLCEVTLPSSVTSIGTRAFYNCGLLTTIVCYATTPPTVGTNAFQNCNNLSVIKVPAGSVDAYKAKSGWSTYASKIVAIEE